MAQLNPVLRDWLETWGDVRANRLSGLDYPSETAEMRLQLFQLDNRGKRQGRIRCRICKKPLRQCECPSPAFGETAKGKQSQKGMHPLTPNYWPSKKAMSVQRAYLELDPHYQIALLSRFVENVPEGRGALICGVSSAAAYQSLWCKSCTKIGKILGFRHSWEKSVDISVETVKI